MRPNIFLRFKGIVHLKIAIPNLFADFFTLSKKKLFFGKSTEKAFNGGHGVNLPK